jgi:hypothetical protein
MKDPNLPLLETAARVLHPVLDELVFVGGSVTGLLITDAGSAGVRSTLDVDAITEVASYAGYVGLSERLRALGLREDTSEGAPACRWRTADVVLDVMPTDPDILGFSNQWYAPAIEGAQTAMVAGLAVRVVTPVYFVATKLEAFRGRGQGDYVASHDLEDVITVVDGRSELVREVRAAQEDVRSFIASEVGRLLSTRAFTDALPGFLLPDEASQQRVRIVRRRLEQLAAA